MVRCGNKIHGTTGANHSSVAAVRSCFQSYPSRPTGNFENRIQEIERFGVGAVAEVTVTGIDKHPLDEELKL